MCCECLGRLFDIAGCNPYQLRGGKGNRALALRYDGAEGALLASLADQLKAATLASYRSTSEGVIAGQQQSVMRPSDHRADAAELVDSGRTHGRGWAQMDLVSVRASRFSICRVIPARRARYQYYRSSATLSKRRPRR